MALAHPRTSPSEYALLAFLRVVADGEIFCEQARQCVCEAHDFMPHEYFRIMQHSPPKGFITARDVHSWLADQPHRLPLSANEDVATFFLPHANAKGEMRYEGFLRMVLPRDDHGLREVVLNRSTATHPHDTGRGYTSPETSYRLCRFLEEEIELARHMRVHRQALRDQGLNARAAFALLSPERPSTAGFLAHAELRALLVQQRGEMSAKQCEAMLRRVGQASAAGLTYEDVAHLLQPHGTDDAGRGAPSPGCASGSAGVNVTGASPSQNLPSFGSSLQLPAPISTPRRSLTSPKSAIEAASTMVLSSRTPTAPYRSPTSQSLEAPAAGRPRVRESDLCAVLALMERQAQLDNHLEETKKLWPSDVPLKSAFELLDTGCKGYVTDTDLWHFGQKMGRLPFSSIFALIRELQSGHDINGRKEAKLSLDEIGMLLRRRQVPEQRTMGDAGRPTSSVEQDVGAAGMLSLDAQRSFFRIIEASAAAADEIEGLRKQLLLMRPDGLLQETFNAISGGKDFFTFMDLRSAFFQQGFQTPDWGLRLVWQRYAGMAEKVTLAGYAQQVHPLMSQA